jgi:hypothetical protein
MGGGLLGAVSGALGVCVLYVLAWHLMGSAGCRAAWLKSQSVGVAACYTIGAVICSLPWRRLRSGARCDLLVGYAGLNSVPSLSMACIMIARRRASATRALRIVDRRAIAKAQSLSFSGGL